MNIVLVEPDIPGNTGNVGRSCVGTESTLHLVGKLGFSLGDKYLKRSGLDYWKRLDLRRHKDWDAFMKSEKPGSLFFFEKDAGRSIWDARFQTDSYLVFGSETRGFPENLAEKYRSSFYRIPMTGPVRSLNLASAAAVALYEAVRQTRKEGGHDTIVSPTRKEHHGA